MIGLKILILQCTLPFFEDDIMFEALFRLLKGE